MQKIGFMVVVFIAWLALVGFLLMTPSYRMSIQAKLASSSGDYEKAHELATQAELLDPYNRMAMAIARESEDQLALKRYIRDAKETQKVIMGLLSQKSITKEQKLRIKLMLEVAIGQYENSASIKRVGNDLTSAQLYKWFADLYARAYQN